MLRLGPLWGSPWLVAVASTLLAGAAALSLKPAALEPAYAPELRRVRRSPERAAVAFTQALAHGREALAHALSSGPARRALQEGQPLQPLPETEVWVEELRRLPDGRAELIATTTLPAGDAELVERVLRVVLRQREEGWYVDEIGWLDGE